MPLRAFEARRSAPERRRRKRRGLGGLLALVVLVLPLGANATPSSSSAVLNEPTTSVLDDFERGLEDPLFQWGNWASTSITGTGPTMENLGGSAGHNEGDTHGDSYRTAGIPTGDAEVYGTIAVNPSDQRSLYLYLNLQQAGTPGVDGYELRWFHWISVDGLYLSKIVDGVTTNLVAPLQQSPEPAAGDTLLLRRVGTTLEVWHESGGTWLLRLSATDGDFQGGKIGFGSDENKARWADFGGSGQTTPEPPAPTLPGTGVLDAFDRSDEDPLSQSGSWSSTPIGGSGQTLEVLSLTAGQNEGEVVQANSFRLADVTGDAEVHARIANVPENDQVSYLYLHLQQAGTAGFDGYRMRWYHWIVADHLSIEKIVDGVATTLVGPIGLDPSGGDTLLLRRVGEGLELWRGSAGGWSKLLTSADASFDSGKLGLGLDDERGKWDDFGGGALAGPPPPPPAGPPPEQSHGICTGSGVHAHSTSRCLSDPVNTLTGAFITEVEDIATAGTGVPFAWSRTYTSSDPTAGRLGVGWTDSYSVALVVHPSGDVTLRGDEGQHVEYTRQADGSFVGAPGALSTLAPVAGGYELVRTDQIVYRFDGEGQLLSQRDRNGQGLTFAHDGQGRLTRITDAANRETTVAYNAAGLVDRVSTSGGHQIAYGYSEGRLTSATDVLGNTWGYTYDSRGRLATIVDPLQHTQVTNVYGSDDRVLTQTDAAGKTTAFAWDPVAEIASVTDANGNVWEHHYDDSVLSRQIDPLNRVVALAHDADLNTTGVASPKGETTTMAYDAAGNVLSATAPSSLGSAQKTFVYNSRNDPVRVTDARGTVTSYLYDASGNTTSVTQAGNQVASYTYDAGGRALTSVDGNGKTSSYTYDADGNLASVTDPLGNRTSYTYDAAGHVLTRVDPKGNLPGATPADFASTWSYDAAGRVLTERDPLGHVTTHVYDDAGNELSVTDAHGRATSYAYDEANRVVSVTRPDPDDSGPLQAPATAHTYDDVGNTLSTTDPLGRTTSFAYDSANRLVATNGPDPDGAGPLVSPTTSRTYDANGNLASVVEPRGNVSGASPDDFRTRYSYDAAGRLLTTTDPLGYTTTNVYDSVGNLVSVRDASDHTTAYAFDAEGRVVAATAADGGTTNYTYDGAGRLLTRRDDSDHVTRYVYDGAGRLVTEEGPDPDGIGPHSSAVTTHRYDANGNVETTVDPNGNATSLPDDGKTAFGYDRANRLASIDYSDATPDVTFSYDAVGNRLRMTDGAGTEARTYDGLDRLVAVTRGSTSFAFAYDPVGNVLRRTYPGGKVSEYDYDGLDRLSNVRSGGQAVGYAYDAASNLLETTLPAGNGLVELRSYDRAGRLTEVSSRRGATILSRFVASLDPVGNPTQVVRTGGLDQSQSYGYDAADRIVSVCLQAGTCAGSSDPFIRWTYDGVGNRLSEQRPSGTTPYSYDAADRLLSAGPTSYAYDENGNTLSAGRRTFTYDLANRMNTTRLGSTTTTYSYDGDGIRLRASTGSKSAQQTNFHWDVSHALPQIAVEENGAGSVLRSYTYGVRRESVTSGSATSYYHYDGLGSVANVTSSSGATRWTYAYEPFGAILTEQRSGGNAPTNAMKFAGEHQDPTGLYHLRARQYDPAVGRFLSPDPVEAGIGLPVVATYAYSANRPTVMVDPSGAIFRPADGGQTMPIFVGSPVDWRSPLIRCQSPLCGGRRPNPRRVHPIPRRFSTWGGTLLHRTSGLPGYPALDFGGASGTPVVAVERGYIREFGDAQIGDALYLRGDSGIDYWYGHIRRSVSRGARVQLGQIVGSTVHHFNGDHLHLGANANVGGEIIGRQRAGTDDSSDRGWKRGVDIMRLISTAPRV